MTSPLLLLGYVAMGIAADFLITRYYVAVYTKQRLAASALAAAITLLTIYVFDQIITSNSMLLMAAWALGNSIGTYIGIGD